MLKSLHPFAFCLVFLFSVSKLNGQAGLFFPDTISVLPGDEFTMPVKVLGFDSIVAIESAFEWDTSVVQLIDIVDINLNYVSPTHTFNFNGYINGTSNCILRFAWYDVGTLGISQPDSFSMFSLKFLAKGPVGSSTPVKFVSDLLSPGCAYLPLFFANNYGVIIYEADMLISHGFVQIAPNVSSNKTVEKIDPGQQIGQAEVPSSDRSGWVADQPGTLKLYPNFPNPWSQQTSIPFELSRPEMVTLSVLNQLGQVVYTKKSYFESGLNSFHLENHFLNTSGELLFYRIETKSEAHTSRMIYQNRN